MKVFIIIPTYNRSNDLRELLNSLKKQTMKSDTIIVADQSTEDFREKNEQLCREYGATYLYVKEVPSLTITRNYAIEFLFEKFKVNDEDLVVFLDDDVILPKKFIRNIIDLSNKIKNFSIIGMIPSNFLEEWRRKSMIKKFLGILAGLVGYYGSSYIKNSLNRMFYNQWLRKIKFAESDWVSGCCLVTKIKIVKRVRFDENLVRWSFMEDIDFCYRAKKYGKICVIPIVIKHKVSEEGRLQKIEKILMETIYPYYLLKKNIRSPFSYNMRKIFDIIFAVRSAFRIILLEIMGKDVRSSTLSIIVRIHTIKLLKWDNIDFIIKKFNKKLLSREFNKFSFPN